MTKIVSGLESAAMGLLQSQLETEGIACEIRNNALGTLWGSVPFGSELWVLRDDEVERARDLINTFVDPAPEQPRSV